MHCKLKAGVVRVAHRSLSVFDRGVAIEGHVVAGGDGCTAAYHVYTRQKTCTSIDLQQVQVLTLLSSKSRGLLTCIQVPSSREGQAWSRICPPSCTAGPAQCMNTDCRHCRSFTKDSGMERGEPHRKVCLVREHTRAHIILTNVT